VPLLAALACTALPAPADDAGDDGRSLVVTATAYNSVPEQTNERPALTAWGDHLEPGMKAIAVSHDLVELGLDHGVQVEIEGLPGRYTVRDRMARRWKRKIDIYMGRNVEAARAWGRRRVTIRWHPR
jgi:3D (Asp-Asp-Asp) domain-containing protein